MADTRRFFAIEVSHAPNSGGASAVWGQGGVAGESILRASDIGYRSEANPSLAYPAHMLDGLTIDRQINVEPGQIPAGAAWGKIRLANTRQQYDVVASTRNCANRTLTVRTGLKTRDPVRGTWTDPAFAALWTFFAGMAMPWTVSENSLDIGVRDASYWLEKPLQRKQYTGAGGLNGHAGLTGVNIPMARGGWSGFPIQNVTPVLVDPVNRIYQYTDAGGSIQNLYEGGALNITFQANVTDLYTGSTTAGMYRTCNNLGLFQLGSTPVRAITCDVRGQYPVAGALDDPYSLALAMLQEDCALPAGSIYLPSFSPSGAITAMQCGVYFDSNPITGTEAVGQLLASCYTVLFPRRDGKLALCQLNGVGAPAPLGLWTKAQIVRCLPRDLPAILATPTYRWRWGYKHNYTVQTSDLNATVTDARKAILAAADQFAINTNATVVNNYKAPGDPDPRPSAILDLADANVMANVMQQTWGKANSRLFDVTVPIEIGINYEIGQFALIYYPLDILDDNPTGTYALIVGEQFRAADGVTTFTVMI